MAAVVIPCLLMTYGGISLFVVVFVIYPMGYAIYRAADLPCPITGRLGDEPSQPRE